MVKYNTHSLINKIHLPFQFIGMRYVITDTPKGRFRFKIKLKELKGNAFDFKPLRNKFYYINTTYRNAL